MKHIRISSCYCFVCNNKFPIPRTGKQREKGHVKDLYCPICRRVTSHIEVREKDFILSTVIGMDKLSPSICVK